jgi:hypothetical protein
MTAEISFAQEEDDLAGMLGEPLTMPSSSVVSRTSFATARGWQDDTLAAERRRAEGIPAD